jgi:hypothetical protein
LTAFFGSQKIKKMIPKIHSIYYFNFGTDSYTCEKLSIPYIVVDIFVDDEELRGTEESERKDESVVYLVNIQDKDIGLPTRMSVLSKYFKKGVKKIEKWEEAD